MLISVLKGRLKTKAMLKKKVCSEWRKIPSDGKSLAVEGLLFTVGA
jgi:hypothetical protein